MPENATLTSPHEGALPTPGFFETYGSSYALGLLLLLPGILLIGSQPLYSFTPLYGAVLIIPPVAASFLLLAIDPSGPRSTAAQGALGPTDHVSTGVAELML